jgi:hypothetical protein
MPLTILIIVVFVTVALAVFAFGAAVVTPTSVLGARLRALGSQATQAPEKPVVKVRQRLEQALDPLSKAIPLSPSDVSRTRAWLIQAGLRESAPDWLWRLWASSALSLSPDSTAFRCWSACPRWDSSFHASS